MKQYDKIFTPNDLDQLETKYMLIGPDGHYPIGGLDQQENVIVLTIEELRKIWEAAERRILSGPTSVNYKGEWVRDNPDFPTYLQSKGIDPTK